MIDNIIIKAAQFAKNAHEGQRRKYSGTPYILHPSRVAARTMLLDNATTDMVCSAFLHDVIEDCGVLLNHLEEEFGFEVSSLVWQLTNPSKGNHLPRSERKEMDRRHLRLVSNEAKCIKLLDRIDNIDESFQGPKDWCCLYIKESKLLLEALENTCLPLEKELMAKLIKLGNHLGIEP